MPLDQATLQAQLLLLDEPSPGQDVGTCANKWFDAFWSFYSGCSQLNPLTLPAAQQASRVIFVPLVAAGMTPNPVPLTFFLALEGALRAVLAATLTPAFMLPTFLVGVPSPVPLAPLLVPTVAVGLASGGAKAPPRAALAVLLHTWMLTNTVTLVPPATGAVPLL